MKYLTLTVPSETIWLALEGKNLGLNAEKKVFGELLDIFKLRLPVG